MQWYPVRLWGEGCGFDAQSQQPEMTLGIIQQKCQKSTGDDESILTLKLVSRVIRSPKQRVPVDLTRTSVPQKLKKKNIKQEKIFVFEINKNFIEIFRDTECCDYLHHFRMGYKSSYTTIGNQSDSGRETVCMTPTCVSRKCSST